jgi:hypothetical protein
MSGCENSQASSREAISPTGSPGERCVIFQGVIFPNVWNFILKRTGGLKFPGRIIFQTVTVPDRAFLTDVAPSDSYLFREFKAVLTRDSHLRMTINFFAG